jgi:predicted nucleic acid-binding protein
MSARSFHDSNDLLYSDASDAPRKQQRAVELLAEQRTAGTGVLSLQVLQEHLVAATRKLAVDVGVARRKVELFARYQVVVLDVEDVLAAVDLHRLQQLSFWEALIVRAAREGGCVPLIPAFSIHGTRRSIACGAAPHSSRSPFASCCQIVRRRISLVPSAMLITRSVS